MKLSLPTWSLPSLTLSESQGVARALHFDGIDVGLLYRSGLDKNKILSDPEGAAREVQANGMPIANYYHLFGDGLEDRNLSLPEHHRSNLQDLDKAASFCAAAGIPTLFVLPGIVNPGQSVAESREASSTALREGVAIAAGHGVQLIIEPHVRGIVESPDSVLALIEQVPGLKLALDYAHFVCLGYPQGEVDLLVRHAAHVHLRQARPGRLQERFPYGTINFPGLLSKLNELDYAGWVAPEPLHQDYIDSWQVDVLTELVTFRDLVREWGRGGNG